MPKRCRGLAAGLVGILTLSLTAAPAAAQTPPGADSPQALVARLTKAAETRNFAEVVACLDPESRSELTMGLLMATTMMVAFMGMGSDMAAGMAQGMAEGLSGEKMKPEDKAKLEKGKAEAADKMAKSKADLSAIFKKHGVPDLLGDKAPAAQDPGGAAALLKKVDQPALVADLLRFMEAFGDKKTGPDSGPSVPFPSGSVTDYKISGDRATAKAGKETIDLVRLDGRWFFKAPKKEQAK